MANHVRASQLVRGKSTIFTCVVHTKLGYFAGSGGGGGGGEGFTELSFKGRSTPINRSIQIHSGTSGCDHFS